MELAALAVAAVAAGVVWLTVRAIRAWWKRWRRRNRRTLRLLSVGGVVAVAAVLGVQQVPPTTVLAVGLTVIAVLAIIGLVSARSRGRQQFPQRSTPDSSNVTPVAPDVRPAPGRVKGMYAIGFGNRAVAGGSVVTDWKVGHGDIERRISAHTSAVAHPRLVVMRLPCLEHDMVERRVLRDLRRWKINQPTIPGEELFEAAPDVEVYLRELFRRGSIEDRRR